MSWFYRIGRPLVWLCCKIVWRMKIKMLSPMPDGPLILCCNHQHALDPFVWQCRPSGRCTIWRRGTDARLFGMALHKVGSYAVDRGANDVGAVKKTLTLLKEGRVVGIFRKGTGARRGSA